MMDGKEESDTEPSEDKFNLGRKIFVGNISYRIKQAKLSNFFGKFGEVEYTYIVKDHVKNWSRGIAFVTFSQQEGAELALKATADQLRLDGREMRVAEAEESKRYSYIERGYWHPKNQSRPTNHNTKKEEVEENDEECETDAEVLKSGFMDKLNDDVLTCIFCHLPILDRVRIERVCHRWFTIARSSWSRQRSLQFKNIFRRFKGLTDVMLCGILHRCGAYLKSLDVSASPTLLTDMAVDAIAQRCPSLERIDLTGVSVTDRSLKTQAESCPNLTRVIVKNCLHINDKGISWLLERCRKLKHLDVSSNFEIKGNCFSCVGSTIGTLHLNRCYKLKDHGIDKICHHCGDLQELHLQECTAITDKSLQVISAQCRHLKDLDLSRVPSVTQYGLIDLCQLKSLESLNLSKNINSVDDNVLCAIAKGCKKLRSLNISECHQFVSDDGVQRLADCPVLTDLDISYIHMVQDSSLLLIAQNGKLRKFTAKACSGITDKSILAIAEMCHHLELIDLSGNYNITNKSLLAITESLAVENVGHITLNIGGTSIVSEDITTPGNVDLCLQDLSQTQLRGDREIILPSVDDDQEEDSEHTDHDHENALQHGGFPAGAENEFDNDWAEVEDEFEDFDDYFLENDDPLEMERWEYS